MNWLWQMISEVSNCAQPQGKTVLSTFTSILGLSLRYPVLASLIEERSYGSSCHVRTVVYH